MDWLARWALTGMMILGMMAWWWPGYRSWGSAVSALATVLALWLAARIVAGDRRVPGHPIHLVVLVPAGIMAMHLARDILAKDAPTVMPFVRAISRNERPENSLNRNISLCSSESMSIAALISSEVSRATALSSGVFSGADATEGSNGSRPPTSDPAR